MTEQDVLKSTSQVLMTISEPSKEPSKELSPRIKEAFEKAWIEAVKDIPVPSWCDPKRLADVLARETEEYYVEHRLNERLEKILKISRNVGEAFISYANAIDDYSDAMVKVLKGELQKKPKAFYRSDFPLSLLTKLDLLKHTQVQAYIFLKDWVGSFVQKASRYKGDTLKFHNFVEIPCDKKLEPLVTSFNESEKASSSLLAYIRIWNVNAYEELLIDRPLSREKINHKIFAELYQKFDETLYSLRNTLLVFTPKTYFGAKTSSSTVRMLGGLLLSEAPQ